MDEETVRDILHQIERSHRGAGFYRGFLVSVEFRLRTFVDRLTSRPLEANFLEMMEILDSIEYVLKEGPSHEQQRDD